jgi:hypothetical protein
VSPPATSTFAPLRGSLQSIFEGQLSVPVYEGAAHMAVSLRMVMMRIEQACAASSLSLTRA